MTTIAQLFNSPSARPCLLVEVVVAGTTIYMSTRGYVTSPAETPASTIYKPVIIGGVSYNESLDSSISYGDIEVSNANGELDDWLTMIWDNSPINIYIGDSSWPRANFIKVLSGIIGTIVSRDRETLNLTLRDKMELLQSPVTESVLGGTTDNADELIPLCFGECFNVTPLLTNPATLEYQVHNGRIERIIEVRDNGAPVEFVGNLTTGKFTLTRSPSGQITCSVQGDAPAGVYSNKITPVIKRLVKDFGSVDTRLTDSDLDLVSLTAFDSANQQSIGLYMTTTTAVSDAISQLAGSIGAGVVFGRNGTLKLVKLDLASGGESIGPNQRIGQSLMISDRPKVRAGVDVGYCRNWTVQEDIQTGILPEHKQIFAKEYRSSVIKDLVVATLYKIGALPEQEPTLLIATIDANGEATRRNNLWKVQRTVLNYSGVPSLLETQPGDYQTITASRFGLTGGANVQVLSTQVDWIKPGIEIMVMM